MAKIETIPEKIDELLYEWQRQEIMKKVKAPIVAVLEDPKDPTWVLLDSLLTPSNNILPLGIDNWIACSIHEILSGHNAVWLMDDYRYTDSEDSVPTSILINAQDLRSIQEGGVSGLIQDSLFGGF